MLLMVGALGGNTRSYSSILDLQDELVNLCLSISNGFYINSTYIPSPPDLSLSSWYRVRVLRLQLIVIKQNSRNQQFGWELSWHLHLSMGIHSTSIIVCKCFSLRPTIVEGEQLHPLSALHTTSPGHTFVNYLPCHHIYTFLIYIMHRS